jgi:hypothetical protein
MWKMERRSAFTQCAVEDLISLEDISRNTQLSVHSESSSDIVLLRNHKRHEIETMVVPRSSEIGQTAACMSTLLAE